MNKLMTKVTRVILKAGFITLALCQWNQAAVAAPSGVKIKGLSFAGSGCPAGSISGRLGSGFDSFTLFLDDMIAETGPYVSVREKRKNCMISVDLYVPAGWSYSIAEIEYKGFVDLERGVTAKQTASYYFQGQSTSARLGTNLYGPMVSTYKIKDTLAIESQVWSPCGAGRALNINAQVYVTSSNRYAYGLITLDKIKGSVEQVYGLNWKRCH